MRYLVSYSENEFSTHLKFMYFFPVVVDKI